MTHGQCNARPTVTFLLVAEHRPLPRGWYQILLGKWVLELSFNCDVTQPGVELMTTWSKAQRLHQAVPTASISALCITILPFCLTNNIKQVCGVNNNKNAEIAVFVLYVMLGYSNVLCGLCNNCSRYHNKFSTEFYEFTTVNAVVYSVIVLK